jgi:hypothetical protein
MSKGRVCVGVASLAVGLWELVVFAVNSRGSARGPVKEVIVSNF